MMSEGMTSVSTTLTGFEKVLPAPEPPLAARGSSQSFSDSETRVRHLS
jgi:hypothetical protein